MAKLEERRDKNGNITGYRVRVCVGRNELGKQDWRTTTIKYPEGLTPKKAEKEAQRLADAWEKEKRAEYERDHAKHDKTKISFAEFVNEHWMADHVRNGDHTPSTVAFYHYMSLELITYFGNKKLSAIDTESIKRWVRYLNTEARTKDGLPLSPATIQREYETLRNILRYAYRLDFISKDPTEKLIQQEKPRGAARDISQRENAFLTPEQAHRFLDCLACEPLRLKTMLTLMIQTGLRRGETVGLQWGDIDINAQMLTVQRNVTLDTQSPDKIHVGATKTGESRTVPLTASLVSLLCEFKAEQERNYEETLFKTAYVFCSEPNPYAPCYPTTPTRALARFVKRHDLPPVSPHDLRHTFATLALSSGANMKALQLSLGHKNITTTLSHYAGVTEKDLRSAVEGVEFILTGTEQ